MEYLERVALSAFTTFRIGGPARLFCRATTAQDVASAADRAAADNLPLLILGGGSNMVVSDSGFPGLVVRMELQGVAETVEGDDVRLSCAAGEPWDSMVARAVSAGYWGIENLSHIPGNVGAFAVQNVGAYGQEASQMVESVSVFDLHQGAVTRFPGDACGFGYRRSIFNTADKGRYVILEVVMRLRRTGKPNLSYPDVARYFAGGASSPNLAEIRQAIIEIRDRKFTTPDKIPNAGSFFKNFILTEGQYRDVERAVDKNFSPEVGQRLRDYRARLTTPTGIKIPAAFLIEACGLKGLRVGGIQVNEAQPLVLLNPGRHATAHDVLEAIRIIRQALFEKTGLELAPEPELIGFSPEEIRSSFALR